MDLLIILALISFFYCHSSRRSSNLLSIIFLGKYKAQKIAEFSFLNPFQMIFLKFCPQNLMQFEHVPIIGAQNTMLSSYVEGHVKKNSSPNFVSLVLFQVFKI